jgi:hypothetical protein
MFSSQITASANDIPLVTMHRMLQYQQEHTPPHYEWHVCYLMGTEFAV